MKHAFLVRSYIIYGYFGILVNKCCQKAFIFNKIFNNIFLIRCYAAPKLFTIMFPAVLRYGPSRHVSRFYDYELGNIDDFVIGAP